MKLTRQQRLLLFAGEPVKITYPGREKCPIPTGHIEELSANVRLEVTGKRRTRSGDWALTYTLHNNRLGQRFLARQQGQAHPAQYVSNSAGGIDHEAGEAVDDFTQKRQTREARERERETLGQYLAAVEDVRAAIRDRMESNPDFLRVAGRDVWLLRSKLDAVERKLRRKAA